MLFGWFGLITKILERTTDIRQQIWVKPAIDPKLVMLISNELNSKINGNEPFTYVTKHLDCFGYFLWPSFVLLPHILRSCFSFSSSKIGRKAILTYLFQITVVVINGWKVARSTIIKVSWSMWWMVSWWLEARSSKQVMNTRTESQVREREGGKKDESVGWGGCCLRVLHKSKVSIEFIVFKIWVIRTRKL